MTDKREDLRVTKTKRNIKAELRKLLHKKPIQKITVKELCENALINKGTFYLHYEDLYTLYREVITDCIDDCLGSLSYYDEFFTSPKDFVRKFLHDFQMNDFSGNFPHMDVHKDRLQLPTMVDEIVLGHILATGLVEPTTENKIKIHCCMSTMTAPLMHFGVEYRDTIAKISGELIANSFKRTADGKTFE